MSFLLECPNCGRRPVDEYAYGGEVTVRPTSSEDARALFSYLYFKQNEAGAAARVVVPLVGLPGVVPGRARHPLERRPAGGAARRARMSDGWPSAAAS